MDGCQCDYITKSKEKEKKKQNLGKNVKHNKNLFPLKIRFPKKLLIFASGFAPLSSIASAIIDSDFAENSMHENRLSLRDLLSITLPFSSSSFFLHNTYSLLLASSSSDAPEQTGVVDSGSHPKRTREGAAAAAPFPVVEFCNSVRKKKKKKQRLGSELLQISRELWSIVGRLQLWNTSTSTSSVADLQRDHRTIDCLALTDGEISICCSVASLHPHFLGQLVQVSILCLLSPAF